MFCSAPLVRLCTTDYRPGIHTTAFLVANVNVFGSSCFQCLPSKHGLNCLRTVWCLKSKVNTMNAIWPRGVKIVHFVHYSPKVCLKSWTATVYVRLHTHQIQCCGDNAAVPMHFQLDHLWYSCNGCHLAMTFATKLKFLFTAVHDSPAQLLCWGHHYHITLWTQPKQSLA